MREKIRILEGIWGDGDNDNDGDDGDGSNKPTENPGQRRGFTDRRHTAKREQKGTPGGETVDSPAQEDPSRHHGGETHDVDSAVVGDKGGASRGDESSGAATGREAGREDEEERGLVEDGGGEGGGGGDAGVDAWLISYNRRLKGELERLRGRTRQAEDRYVYVVCVCMYMYVCMYVRVYSLYVCMYV